MAEDVDPPLAWRRAREPATRLALQIAIGLGGALVMRRTMKASIADRDQEIERRQMLARELAHRTKNSFAIVASLRELQRREANAP